MEFCLQCKNELDKIPDAVVEDHIHLAGRCFICGAKSQFEHYKNNLFVVIDSSKRAELYKQALGGWS
ncbi:MAG: hypothetical protein A4E55_00216 [Pelotomaculum sp. PtaU1.Bin035]|nr:MAG: hypothetical protein A4E55_00216 [Pelotomaculum sp. PtaU1.Bin035]